MDFILGVLSRRDCVHQNDMSLPSYTFDIHHEWWLVQQAAATTCSAQWSSSTVNHLLSELVALWAQSHALRAFTLRALGARLLRASWALWPSRFRSTQSRAPCSIGVRHQQNLYFCTGSTSAVQSICFICLCPAKASPILRLLGFLLHARLNTSVQLCQRPRHPLFNVIPVVGLI